MCESSLWSVRMKTLFAALVLLVGFFTISATACDCRFSNARFDEASAVFYGRVLEVHRNVEKRVVRVKVLSKKTFKGQGQGTLTLNMSSICPYNFQVGKNYLIYAVARLDGILETGPCRVFYGTNAKYERKLLEKGSRPQNR